MWFITNWYIALTRIIAQFFYIGKSKFGNKTYVAFGTARFLTRTNTTDLPVLAEIWRINCYHKAPIREGDVVVDIGAHIGGYSVLAAYHGANVIAYEAEPSNYQLLLTNLRLNGCNNVKAYNAAVSFRNGELTLHTNNASSANSIHSDPSFSSSVRVPSFDLHTVFTQNHLKEVDVLKIDAEGAEYDILLPAKAADLQRISLIIMEYHDFFPHGHNKRELITHLQRHGFTVKEVSPWIQGILFKAGMILASRSKPS